MLQDTGADRPESTTTSSLVEDQPWHRAGSDLAAFLLRTLLSAVIRQGTLQVVLPQGERIEVGLGDPRVRVRILQPATVWRILRNPDLGLGEAYMDGTLVVENGEIYDLITLAMRNIGLGDGAGIMKVHAALLYLTRRMAQNNPLKKSRRNVAHHYDLSHRLYDLFLDPAHQYSCAYFTSPDDTLEHAQQNKMRHIAAKLLLSPGQTVLDIGCGWGGLAQHLATTAGVRVTGLTLSVEQCNHAVKSAAAGKLEDRLAFKLQDYRQAEGRYDRIVSVGMFEHVGVGYYRQFFRKVASLLADDGVALIHTIGSVRPPRATSQWMNKYIFPGAYAPSLSEIAPAIEQAGLYTTDIEVLRLHYAQTLRAWRTRFMAARAQIAAIYDERFCRMWEYYLAYCEGAFRHTGLVVFQIQISRRIGTVPQTRNYIAAWEEHHA
jgi:cyclopropane-fatty-acyl-phospholipid synthase